MTVYVVFAALAIVAILIKVCENRIPMAVYKAGILLYVGLPIVALIYAIWTGWGRWIGNREFALFVSFALLTGIGTGVGVRKHVTQRLEDVVRNRMSSAGARRSPQGWSEIEDLGRHAAVIGRLLSV